MVKHTQTIRQLLPTNCLSVFDHFVRLVLKRLNFVTVLGNHFKHGITVPGQKREKMCQDGPEIGFFKYFERFGH